MSSRHHIDDFMRGRIIGKIEEGRKITDVAREFDIAHSVVSRLWKSFKTTGMCSRRHGGGRVRSTTPAEDRYIVLSAKRNRRTTAQQVANQFLAASGKQISRKTVARRLRGGGLYARRPVVCVPLTRQHRTACLQWCREHHNWTEQDWACVLFSDERRFSLSSDCRRQLIWRESGTAYRPENIQEKDRYPTCSIMMWAGIMINGRTRLHVVANGTLTDQRYIDEVLLPHVRLFRGAVGDKFVFMHDNATCHRTLAVQDCLDSESIQRLVWPARSPDLNPVENVWDALGRQVAGRNYPPTNKNTLIRALTEEWDKLSQQLLDNVVQSMVRRVECCITLHGGHIPSKRNGFGSFPNRSGDRSRIGSVTGSVFEEEPPELKIQAADMPIEMQRSAVFSATQAIKLYSTEKHIAESIKQDFDQMYHPTWHCIVGRNWGSCVTHSKQCYIRLAYKDLTILLYRST
ncbi:transposable element Tcb2 transposase [Trichonephila clavipes]|nr:transposable element Tcb2 transposase [Trichonephila clavipes]